MFKIDKKDLQEFVNKGLKDSEIGKLFNVSPQVIYYQRVKIHKIERKCLRKKEGVKLSKDRLELLIGCLLGDGYMRKEKYSTGPSFSCAHSLKQKDYLLYKSSFFNDIVRVKENYRNIPNKKTGKLYSDITMYLGVNEELNFIYDSFYKNNIKVIPFNLLEEYYTPLAMAIHYMDDGSKSKNSGYILSTCCFSIEECNDFILFLLNKYNIESSLQYNNKIYIKNNSKETFKNLIYPYICESMKYKL